MVDVGANYATNNYTFCICQFLIYLFMDFEKKNMNGHLLNIIPGKTFDCRYKRLELNDIQ